MKSLLLIISIVMLVSAVVFGYLGWVGLNQASVVVEWSTATELDTVGFNLYRSTDPEADPEQVNQEIIPSSSQPLTGGDYKYTDQRLKPGQSYYYWLEDMDANGYTSRYGPIEVKASRGGWLEIAAAVLLAVVGVFGLVNLFGKRGAAQPIVERFDEQAE